MFTSHDWKQVLVLFIPKQGKGEGNDSSINHDNDLHPP
ncbi:hypothetical protein LINGRAHAP2_LOCUS23745 [Linum grandiflorum]